MYKAPIPLPQAQGIRAFLVYIQLSQAFRTLLRYKKHRKEMKVYINKKPTETQACTLKQLAEEFSLPAKGVAVAIDNVMVPRSAWETTVLKDGADIVIVKAFCGG